MLFSLAKRSPVYWPPTGWRWRVRRGGKFSNGCHSSVHTRSLHSGRRAREDGAMTPQERQLVDELFDRLAALENAPRDREAERAVIDGLDRAPHAPYALVQTALVQDEALKRADARIRDLEA